MAKGRGKKVNRTELAATFGVSLPTIDQWVRDGCPFDQRGAGKGKPWVFDTADVAEWRERRAADQAGGEEVTDATALKLRKLAAETEQAELALAKEKGLVAPIADFERAQAKVFAVIQQNVMQAPQRVVRSLLGETDATRFKEVLSRELAEALEKAAATDLSDDDDEGDDAA